MTLRQEKVIDKMEVLEDGHIQVREATRIFEDDVMIAETFHRHVVSPGQDVTKEDPRVQALAQADHTPERVQRHNAKMDAKRQRRAQRQARNR